MRLFLDASVMLAAANSRSGGSRFIVDAAAPNGWTLLSGAYGIAEVERHLAKLGAVACADWPGIKARLQLVEDDFVIDRPSVFAARKDRPILFTAYSHADTLLTLDLRDFVRAIGHQFYHLEIMTPEQFIRHERIRGTISIP